jgi:NAD(P)-dependent dehydrogenase (short-subunit alcohol dehydrogenase family)
MPAPSGRLAGKVALITGAGNYHVSRAARRRSELPLRRFGSVDDVAYRAIVLAADDAGFLTGQILHPSGGWVSG